MLVLLTPELGAHEAIGHGWLTTTPAALTSSWRLGHEAADHASLVTGEPRGW